MPADYAIIFDAFDIDADIFFAFDFAVIFIRYFHATLIIFSSLPDAAIRLSLRFSAETPSRAPSIFRSFHAAEFSR